MTSTTKRFELCDFKFMQVKTKAIGYTTAIHSFLYIVGYKQQLAHKTKNRKYS